MVGISRDVTSSAPGGIRNGSGPRNPEIVAAHEWARNAELAIDSDAGGGVLDEQGRPLYCLVQGVTGTGRGG
jgi:hypothetical protein